MQYVVIFSLKKKFKTEGMPHDFVEKELEEQEHVRVLYAEGGLREVWAQVPKTLGGVILFEAESLEHLQKMIDGFPLVNSEYADYLITPLQPHAAFMPNPALGRPPSNG